MLPFVFERAVFRSLSECDPARLYLHILRADVAIGHTVGAWSLPSSNVAANYLQYPAVSDEVGRLCETDPFCYGIFHMPAVCDGAESHLCCSRRRPTSSRICRGL